MAPEREMIASVILTEYQNNKHQKQAGQQEQVINQNTCGNQTSLGLKKGTLLHKLVISTRLSLSQKKKKKKNEIKPQSFNI